MPADIADSVDRAGPATQMSVGVARLAVPVALWRRQSRSAAQAALLRRRVASGTIAFGSVSAWTLASGAASFSSDLSLNRATEPSSSRAIPVNSVAASLTSWAWRDTRTVDDATRSADAAFSSEIAATLSMHRFTGYSRLRKARKEFAAAVAALYEKGKA